MLKKIIIGILILALLFVIYIFSAFKAIQLTSGKMEPTLMRGSTYYVWNFLFAPKQIQKSSVYLFKRGGEEDFGRVIAQEGDRIKLSKGEIYINDAQLAEAYLVEYKSGDITINNKFKTYPMGDWLLEDVTVTVPQNSFFILGDNRTNSNDSRSNNLEFVSKNEITGVFLIK